MTDPAAPTASVAPTPPAPSKTAEPAPPRSFAKVDKPIASIAVNVVRFKSPHNIPGNDSASSVQCKTPPPGHQRWTCTLVLWMRSFEITFYPAAGRPPVVGYVHESHADSWEAAA